MQLRHRHEMTGRDTAILQPQTHSKRLKGKETSYTSQTMGIIATNVGNRQRKSIQKIVILTFKTNQLFTSLSMASPVKGRKIHVPCDYVYKHEEENISGAIEESSWHC